MAWFSLTPDESPTNPSNYTNVGNTRPTTCEGQDQICAIQANDNGSGQPVLTDALKNDMISALHNRANNSNVSLKEQE